MPYGKCLACGKDAKHKCTDCTDAHCCSTKCYKSETMQAHFALHAETPSSVVDVDAPFVEAGDAPKKKKAKTLQPIAGSVADWFGIYVTEKTWYARTQFKLAEYDKINTLFPLAEKPPANEYFKTEYPKNLQWIWSFLLAKLFKTIIIGVPSSSNPNGTMTHEMIPMSDVPKSKVTHWIVDARNLSVTLVLKKNARALRWIEYLGTKDSTRLKHFPLGTFWSCLTARDRFCTDEPGTATHRLKRLFVAVLPKLLDELKSSTAEGGSLYSITYIENAQSTWQHNGLIQIQEDPLPTNPVSYEPNVFQEYTRVDPVDWILAQKTKLGEWEKKTELHLLKDSLLRAISTGQTLSTPLYTPNPVKDDLENTYQLWMSMDYFIQEIRIEGLAFEDFDGMARIGTGPTPSRRLVIEDSSEPLIEVSINLERSLLVNILKASSLQDFHAYLVDSKIINFAGAEVDEGVQGEVYHIANRLYEWLVERTYETLSAPPSESSLLIWEYKFETDGDKFDWDAAEREDSEEEVMDAVDEVATHWKEIEPTNVQPEEPVVVRKTAVRKLIIKKPKSPEVPPEPQPQLLPLPVLSPEPPADQESGNWEAQETVPSLDTPSGGGDDEEEPLQPVDPMQDITVLPVIPSTKQKKEALQFKKVKDYRRQNKGTNSLRYTLASVLANNTATVWMSTYAREAIPVVCFLLDLLVDFAVLVRQKDSTEHYKIITGDSKNSYLPLGKTAIVKPVRIGVTFKGTETDLRMKAWRCVAMCFKESGCFSQFGKKNMTAYILDRIERRDDIVWTSLIEQDASKSETLASGLFDGVLKELQVLSNEPLPEGTAKFYRIAKEKWTETNKAVRPFFVSNKLHFDIAGKRVIDETSEESAAKRQVIEADGNIAEYFSKPGFRREIAQQFSSLSVKAWLGKVPTNAAVCHLLGHIISRVAVLRSVGKKNLKYKYYTSLGPNHTEDAWDPSYIIAQPLTLKLTLQGSQTSARSKIWEAFKSSAVASVIKNTAFLTAYWSARLDLPEQGFKWMELPSARINTGALMRLLSKQLRKVASSPPPEDIALFFSLKKTWELATANVQYPSLIDAKMISAHSEAMQHTDYGVILDTKTPDSEVQRLLSNVKALKWLNKLSLDTFHNPSEVNGIAASIYFAEKTIKMVKLNGPYMELVVDLSYHDHIRYLRAAPGFSLPLFLLEKYEERMSEYCQKNPELFAATSLIWSILRSGVTHELFNLTDNTRVLNFAVYNKNTALFSFVRDPKSDTDYITVRNSNQGVSYNIAALKRLVQNLPSGIYETDIEKRIVFPMLFTLSTDALITRNKTRDLFNTLWRDKSSYTRITLNNPQALVYWKRHNPTLATLIILEKLFRDIICKTDTAETEWHMAAFDNGSAESAIQRSKTERYVFEIQIDRRWLPFLRGLNPPTKFGLVDYLVYYRGRDHSAFRKLRRASYNLELLWQLMFKSTLDEIFNTKDQTFFTVRGSKIYTERLVTEIPPIRLLNSILSQPRGDQHHAPIVEIGNYDSQEFTFDAVHLDCRMGMVLAERHSPENRQIPTQDPNPVSKERVASTIRKIVKASELWDFERGEYTGFNRNNEKVSELSLERHRNSHWAFQARFILSPDQEYRDALRGLINEGQLPWQELQEILPFQSMELFSTPNAALYFVLSLIDSERREISYIFNQETSRWAEVTKTSPLSHLC